jgi:hypothetical protein
LSRLSIIYNDVLDKINKFCCCGCGANASGSHHTCSVTNRKTMSFCFDSELEEGFGSNGVCVGCANKNTVDKEEESTSEISIQAQKPEAEAAPELTEHELELQGNTSTTIESESSNSEKLQPISMDASDALVQLEDFKINIADKIFNANYSNGSFIFFLPVRQVQNMFFGVSARNCDINVFVGDEFICNDIRLDKKGIKLKFICCVNVYPSVMLNFQILSENVPLLNNILNVDASDFFTDNVWYNQNSRDFYGDNEKLTLCLRNVQDIIENLNLNELIVENFSLLFKEYTYTSSDPVIPDKINNAAKNYNETNEEECLAKQVVSNSKKRNYTKKAKDLPIPIPTRTTYNELRKLDMAKKEEKRLEKRASEIKVAKPKTSVKRAKSFEGMNHLNFMI